MEVQNTNKWKILTIGAVVLTAIPVWIYKLWIDAFSLGSTQEERVEIFESQFPELLQGNSGITLISIGFCVIASLICTYALNKLKKGWRIMTILVLVISGGLLFLNIFSLM